MKKLLILMTMIIGSTNLFAIDLPEFGPKMRISVVKYGLETNNDKHQIHFYNSKDEHIDSVDLQITNRDQSDHQDGYLKYKGIMIAKAIRTTSLFDIDQSDFRVLDEKKDELGRLEVHLTSTGFWTKEKSVKIFKDDQLVATVFRRGKSGKDLLLYVHKTKKNISRLKFDWEDELPKFSGIIGVNATKELELDIRVIMLAMGKAVEGVY